jgi:hypothetical protein
MPALLRRRISIARMRRRRRSAPTAAPRKGRKEVLAPSLVVLVGAPREFWTPNS